MTATIRDSSPDDWAAICRIHDRARPDELRGSFDPRSFVPLARDPEGETLKHCQVFVAEIGSEVIGFAAIDSPYLAWLYVDPSYYRRGIGRSLLKYCLVRLGDEAWTLTAGNNAAAIELYEKEGFVIERRFTDKNAGYEGPVALLAVDPSKRAWTRPRRSQSSAEG